MYRGEALTFSVVPADPYYAWSAVLSPRDYQWALADPMGMQSAWNAVRGTAYLAHLDNGIQITPVTGGMHPDLVQAIRRFRYNVNGTTDVDEHPELVWDNAGGHGTHTAGIMAAATSQASVPAGYPNPPTQGVAATCWYCSLLIAKVSRINGSGIIQIDTTDMPGAIN